MFALLLSACAARQDATHTLSSAPTTIAELQDATVLTVERYRPQYKLKGCKLTALPVAKPDAALQAALEEAASYSKEASGLGLVVMQNGAIVYRNFADGVDGDTHFISASMMKSVLALLFGIALDNGMIASVDDHVGDYLEEWRNDTRGTITLRQLLTMSSGLAQSDFEEILLSADIGAAALELQQETSPDETFRYNNAVSQLIAIVLDRRAKAKGYQGLTDFFHSDLWCPLGNGPASLWIDAANQPRGYAGLHAGIDDWIRIGELIRNRGQANNRQIVSANWIDMMMQPSAANPQYGLHIWLGDAWTQRRRYSPTNPISILHSEPYTSEGIIFLDGFGGQRVYVLPDQGLTIARFGLVNLDYDDAIIPNLLTRAKSQ